MNLIYFQNTAANHTFVHSINSGNR